MSEIQTTDVPKGYIKRADGALIKVDHVAAIDHARSALVHELAEEAKKVSADMVAYKLMAMSRVDTFIAGSLSKYGVKATRGTKGNVTLIAFDGQYKVEVQVADNIMFDERLSAAKELVDECVRDLMKGANKELQKLITHAFESDKDGKISTTRVLSLRRLKIDHPKWSQAMDALTDSVTVVDSKRYIRIYERAENGAYLPIPLDIAGV
jgi:ERCC4-related helicase